jgi:hypothetical protein
MIAKTITSNPSTTTFYWHDFETTGVDARRDRPLQFAGLRTDMDLRPIEEPTVLYCRPPADVLPAPAACGITGIGPVTAAERGLIGYIGGWLLALLLVVTVGLYLDARMVEFEAGEMVEADGDAQV